MLTLLLVSYLLVQGHGKPVRTSDNRHHRKLKTHKRAFEDCTINGSACPVVNSGGPVAPQYVHGVHATEDKCLDNPCECCHVHGYEDFCNTPCLSAEHRYTYAGHHLLNTGGHHNDDNTADVRVNVAHHSSVHRHVAHHQVTDAEHQEVADALVHDNTSPGVEHDAMEEVDPDEINVPEKHINDLVHSHPDSPDDSGKVITYHRLDYVVPGHHEEASVITKGHTDLIDEDHSGNIVPGKHTSGIAVPSIPLEIEDHHTSSTLTDRDTTTVDLGIEPQTEHFVASPPTIVAGVVSDTHTVQQDTTGVSGIPVPESQDEDTIKSHTYSGVTEDHTDSGAVIPQTIGIVEPHTDSGLAEHNTGGEVVEAHTFHPDGSAAEFHPDGSVVESHPDGSVVESQTVENVLDEPHTGNVVAEHRGSDVVAYHHYIPAPDDRNSDIVPSSHYIQEHHAHDSITPNINHHQHSDISAPHHNDNIIQHSVQHSGDILGYHHINDATEEDTSIRHDGHTEGTLLLHDGHTEDTSDADSNNDHYTARQNVEDDSYIDERDQHHDGDIMRHHDGDPADNDLPLGQYSHHITDHHNDDDVRNLLGIHHPVEVPTNLHECMIDPCSCCTATHDHTCDDVCPNIEFDHRHAHDHTEHHPLTHTDAHFDTCCHEAQEHGCEHMCVDQHPDANHMHHEVHHHMHPTDAHHVNIVQHHACEHGDDYACHESPHGGTHLHHGNGFEHLHVNGPDSPHAFPKIPGIEKIAYSVVEGNHFQCHDTCSCDCGDCDHEAWVKHGTNVNQGCQNTCGCGGAV